MTAVSESAEQVEHTTVLLQEAVEALVTDPDGFYVDVQVGVDLINALSILCAGNCPRGSAESKAG